ncbi:sugar ABC transporter permease, partial [Streptococcus suis]
MIRKFLNRYWGWTFLFVPLVLQVIFFYFPMFQGAFYSFTNWTG